MTGVLPHRKEPCAECPWRRDVPLGKFPPERYRALANTATDMTRHIFACHMSKDERPFACAGYLLQFRHNFSVRLSQLDPRAIRSDSLLFENYREMAVANGVDPDDPALDGVRDD